MSERSAPSPSPVDHHRTRARIVLLTLAFLTAGALASILIAWSLAAWARPTKSNISHSPTHADVIANNSIPVPTDWELGTLVVYTGALGGFRYDLVSEQHWMGSIMGSMSGSANRFIERVRVGWPLRCLEWHGIEHSSWPDKDGFTVAPSRTGLAKFWFEGAAELPPRGRAYPMNARHLPIKPLWLNFAANTFFYTVLFLGLALAIRSWKRSRRACRGQCVWCGYPRRGLAVAVCPECGRTLAQRLANAEHML